jgi:hypothetical protein
VPAFGARSTKRFGWPLDTRIIEAAHIKRQLVSASLLAGARMRAINRRARIIATDPITHLTDARVNSCRAQLQCEHSFEAFETLLGRRAPEVGGHPASIDVLGVNSYPNNQLRADNAEPVHFGM